MERMLGGIYIKNWIEFIDRRIFQLSISVSISIMDREPKTRQETKGRKGKEGKGVYNQKSIRIREELIEKNKNSRKNDNRSVADAPKKK